MTKLNPEGSELVYSSYFGGKKDDGGFGIAVDADGNAYVTGRTHSKDFPTASPVQKMLGGSSDAFVAKVNPDGTALVYSSYLGGKKYDVGFRIAVDAAGYAYVTGSTESINFVRTNSLQAKESGKQDAFVVRLNLDGSVLDYFTYLGGKNRDTGFAIAVDSSGNAYVTGVTGSTDFPTTLGAFQTVSGGRFDPRFQRKFSTNAFVTKLNTDDKPQ